MNGVQIVSILFILSMLYVIRIHIKKGHLPQSESGYWYALWIGLIVIVIRPTLLTGVTSVFAIYRVMDLLSIVAFMILFYLCISNRIENYKIKLRLEALVRKQAMDSAHTNTSQRKKK